MRTVIFAFTLFALLLPLHAQAEEKTVIGTIAEVEGSVTLSGQAASVNMDVHHNDVIKTNAGSRAVILFIDETELVLSENTALKTSKFILDTDDSRNNSAVFNILQGAFLYTSGLIAKVSNPDVTLETPHASIGVRGTEVWGGDEKDKGGYGIFVNDGEVRVTNEGGEAIVGRGEGTLLKSRRSLPTPPRAWGQQRIQRALGSVALKDRRAVRQRMREIKSKRHKALREKFRENMKNRRIRWQENKEGKQLRREDFRKRLRQRYEDRRQKNQDKQGTRQERRQKLRNQGKTGTQNNGGAKSRLQRLRDRLPNIKREAPTFRQR